MSAGLALLGKAVRGKGLNTLDWANAAASARQGGNGVGEYYGSDGIKWGEVARQAFTAGGLALVVNDRFGEDAALNLFGSQLGNIGRNVLGEADRYNALKEQVNRGLLTPEEFDEAFRESMSPYARAQQLNQRAAERAQFERNAAAQFAAQDLFDQDPARVGNLISNPARFGASQDAREFFRAQFAQQNGTDALAVYGPALDHYLGEGAVAMPAPGAATCPGTWSESMQARVANYPLGGVLRNVTFAAPTRELPLLEGSALDPSGGATALPRTSSPRSNRTSRVPSPGRTPT